MQKDAREDLGALAGPTESMIVASDEKERAKKKLINSLLSEELKNGGNVMEELQRIAAQWI